MALDKDILSFGPYLRTARQEKNISLEEIALETRISLNVLRAIETEDYLHLPADVYVKGFLRGYARAVGLNGDEVVKRYLSICNTPTPATSPGLALPKESGGQRVWLRVSVVMVAFAALIVLTLFIMVGQKQKQAPSKATPAPEQAAAPAPVSPPAMTPQPATEASAKTTAENVPIPAAGVEIAAPADVSSQPAKHLLHVEAMEKTWLKVISDGGRPKVYQLEPGDALDLSADSEFNLLLGNAGGVKLVLDKKDLGVPGKSGQVVNLQLPRP